MENNGSEPATKRDLQQLGEQLTEQFRQVETHLLTEFHRYSKGQQARLHDVESSERAMKVRLASLEERVLELESDASTKRSEHPLLPSQRPK
jgi:hypothetical protein